MKPFVKTLLFAGLLFGVGAFIVGKEKIEKLIAIFENMSFELAAIPRDLKFYNFNKIGVPLNFSCVIDLKITNPDYESFTASGFGVAKLRTVDVLMKNTHIGTAVVDLEDIDVPAESEYILKGLKVTGNTLSLTSNAESFANVKISDFQFIVTIEVLGVDYEVGN